MRFLSPLLALASLCWSTAAWPVENPVYQNERLTVPRVDTPDQVGKYQDAVLQLTPQGNFAITSLQVLGQGNVYNVLGITSVEVRKTDTLPLAVYLRVSGVDPTCDYAGSPRIHQRLEGMRFEVNISAPHINPYTGVFVCTADVREYKITVPLQVYGLSAGTYSYSVNGAIAGQFSLEQDNKFVDDCDVTRYGDCR
jgi:hypothetical protein